MPQRILITGASGCVGHYLVDDLLDRTAFDLVLAVRSPEKLPSHVRQSARVAVLSCDVTELSGRLDDLGSFDAAVLVAAGWGGPAAVAVNRDATFALIEALDARGTGRILYFSTASVLNRHGDLLAAAHSIGTDYIRSKYELVAALEGRSWQSEITGLFPTLVLGGGGERPLSHLSRLLIEAAPWAGLVARFRADGLFHLIHAQDIATVVRMLLTATPEPARARLARHVLGAPAVTVNRIVESYAAHFGKRARFRLTLRTWQADLLIRLFRIQLSPWDRYCMENRDQSYDAVLNPAGFGFVPHAPDLTAALAELKALGALQ